MTDTKEPVIDPIEAFVWLFSGLGGEGADVRKAADIATRVRLALSTDEVLVLDRACREAIKNYQRKGADVNRPPSDD
jgi:thiamine pyrophosphate-dependent acetolactate synthase large subunit-like protein